jgi:hypothetical protein
VKPFAKSVLFGSIAGAAPVLLLTVPYGIASFAGRSGLVLFSLSVLAPLLGSAVLVTTSSVVVGLPLTALLKRQNWESAVTYTTVGGLTGFAIMILALLLTSPTGAYWPALFRALGGAVTGQTWWVSTRRPHVRHPDQ